jgi:hypothetical protein
MIEQLSERIARFAYEEKYRHATNTHPQWSALDADERKKLSDYAWHEVFKVAREFRDPYYRITEGSSSKEIAPREYDLAMARTIAKGLVTDEIKTVMVTEVIERPTATFYLKVHSSVEEE